MMRGMVWLGLTMLIGCELGGDPDAPIRRLSELPPPLIEVIANPRTVRLAITYLHPLDVGACPVLDDDFQATLNGVAMVIRERGASIASIFSSEPCTAPWVTLDGPPLATTSAIAMTYSGHTIWVGLEDLLYPRSAQPVPDGPWTFMPGQTITLQWSPRDDFAMHVPLANFRADDTSRPGPTFIFVPVAVTDDRLTLTLPGVTAPGSLEIEMRSTGAPRTTLPCEGASCQLDSTPQFSHPIAWR